MRKIEFDSFEVCGEYLDCLFVINLFEYSPCFILTYSGCSSFTSHEKYGLPSTNAYEIGSVFESFNILNGTVYQLLDVLERKRYKLRRGKGLSQGVIFSYLDTKPLKYIAGALPREKKREIEEYATNLDKFRKMLEDWILGRDRMATMGMLGARLVHEARSALMKITDNYPLIEKYQDNFDSPLRERLTRMVTGGKMLARIFRELDPFLRFRGKRRQGM